MVFGPNNRTELNLDDENAVSVESVFAKEVLPAVGNLAKDLVSKGLHSAFRLARRNDFVANPVCAMGNDEVNYDDLYADCLKAQA